jgi:Gpi18-like mannosyltransferase
MLYIMTAVRRVELWFGVPLDGSIGVVALKVPSLLAYGVGVAICAMGLTPVTGRRAAASAAAAYAICVPLWYNAAVWGQWDAVLCLPLLLAIISALRGRPIGAGIALGVALAVKLQGIVLLPALAIYAWRCWGVRGAYKGLLGMALGWGLAVAPMLPGGSIGREGILRAYETPVDYYRNRTAMACNIWMVTETATTASRQWSSTFGPTDDGPFLGPLTAKQLGLGLFAGYVLVVVIALWRRPTPRTLVLAAAMVAFGFFMLPTQMHERYVVPACALFAVAAAWQGGWRYFWVVSIPATLNQIIALSYENVTTGRPLIGMRDIAAYQPWLLTISLLNIVGLLLVSVWYLHDAFGKEARALQMAQVQV